MAFPKHIVIKAFNRQYGLCGLCGKKLIYQNYEKHNKGSWHAHHVNGYNKEHKLSNCVCLCRNEPENCHFEAHDGDYDGDYVLKKVCYEYWNG